MGSVSCCHSSSVRHQAHTSLGVVRLDSRRRIYAHEVDNVHVVVYWFQLTSKTSIVATHIVDLNYFTWGWGLMAQIGDSKSPNVCAKLYFCKCFRVRGQMKLHSLVLKTTVWASTCAMQHGVIWIKVESFVSAGASACLRMSMQGSVARPHSGYVSAHA